MRSRIAKWGNSLALRLSRTIAADVRLREGTRVELHVEGKSLVVRPSRPKYRLGDLLAQGTPTRSEEIDWGEARGEEEW